MRAGAGCALALAQEPPPQAPAGGEAPHRVGGLAPEMLPLARRLPLTHPTTAFARGAAQRAHLARVHIDHVQQCPLLGRPVQEEVLGAGKPHQRGQVEVGGHLGDDCMQWG